MRISSMFCMWGAIIKSKLNTTFLSYKSYAKLHNTYIMKTHFSNFPYASVSPTKISISIYMQNKAFLINNTQEN